MSFDHFDLDGLGFLVSSMTSGSGFPDPPGRGFDRDIPYRAECSKVSHSLHII